MSEARRKLRPAFQLTAGSDAVSEVCWGESPLMLHTSLIIKNARRSCGSKNRRRIRDFNRKKYFLSSLEENFFRETENAEN